MSTAGARQMIESFAPGFGISAAKVPAPRIITTMHKKPVSRKNRREIRKILRLSRYRPRTLFSETSLEMATGKPAVAMVEIRLKIS